MVTITPCHAMVSDRFPVASFVVQVPPERLFEIACATDPALFHTEHKHRRTQNNFFTTGANGLLRAPAGQATYLLPPEQLRRFAGKRRLYYAVGSYSGPRGENPSFSTPLELPQAAPSIQISADFTGRALDRTRLRGAPPEARYGAAPATLTWGGDLATRVNAPPPGRQVASAYNDGHPAELWNRPAEPRSAGTFGGARAAALDEPLGYEDAPALARQGGITVAAPAARPASAPRATASFSHSSLVSHHESYGGSSSAPRPAPAPRTTPAPRATPAPSGRQTPTFGRPVAPARAAEPPGFEDVPALARGARGPKRRYGDGAIEAVPAPATASPPLQALTGRDESYDEHEPAEAELPADLPDAEVGVSAGVPLTIPEKFKIVLIVSSAESGGELYSAINADGEFNDPRHPAYQRYHIGLSWGLIQFTQRGGALGTVLEACRRRDPERFRAVFGDSADELLTVVTAATEEERLQPVAGAALWQEPWLARFREAGSVPPFQAAQNQVAIEGYFDPNLQFATWFGLKTDRALAMLYDRCVNMGNGAGRSFVARAIGPIRTQRQRAAALEALNMADLRAFQRSTPGLVEDGSWGPLTHAALYSALASLGSSSPVALPTLAGMLDALQEGGAGRAFASRLRKLRTTTDLHDTIYDLA